MYSLYLLGCNVIMYVVLKLYYYYYFFYVFYSNRRRVELGLVNDPSTHMNDAELASFIVDLQLTSPNIGQSLVIGRLRSLIIVMVYKLGKW